MRSDAEIREALRTVVRIAVEEDRLNTLSKNTARAHAEKQLGLTPGYLKSDKWSSHSADIISEAVDDFEKPEEAESQSPPRKRKQSATTSNGATAKRQKRKPSLAFSEAATPPESPDEESDQAGDYGPARKSAASPGQRLADDSESEMSDVLDEPAPKKKKAVERATKSNSSKAAAAKPKKATNATADLTPNEAEIKSLQSWLLKCGIRKLWHNELKNCDTDKSKIKHLKQMLTDAGMTGRYSNDKAAAIKERRELEADLAAVTERNKVWGDGGDIEERPRRRSAKSRTVESDEGSNDDDQDEEDVEFDDDDEDDPVPTKKKVTSRFVDFGDDGDSDE